MSGAHSLPAVQHSLPPAQPSLPAAAPSLPAALPDPPGRAADLVAALVPWSTAAFSAGLLCHLLTPAPVLRGWTGADAEAAAAQLSVSSRVAVAVHEVIGRSVARLQTHAELWLLVEQRLAVLRRDQEDQFAAASTVLARYGNPVAVLSAGEPPARATALVADYEEGEAARRVGRDSAGRPRGGSSQTVGTRAAPLIDEFDPPDRRHDPRSPSGPAVDRPPRRRQPG